MSKATQNCRPSVLIVVLFAATGPAVAGLPDVTQAQMATRLLASHNATRAIAGVGPLTWDARLQADANVYASYLASHNSFAHSQQASRNGAGENLWMGTRNAFSLEDMFQGWETEKRLFRPGYFPAVSRRGSWHEVGHYTQIIWPQTRRVGCAVASNLTYDFLVCRYWPAGNVHGQLVPNTGPYRNYVR